VANVTREGLKAALMRRYSPRLHMSLILAACGLAAMCTSWSLLHMGVHSMLARYPIAISLAYVTFLVGVWTWLRAMGFIHSDGSARSSFDGGNVDIPVSSGGGGGGGSSLSLPRVGGGNFDGGGASASFAENQAMPMAMMSNQPAPTTGLGKIGGGGGSSSKGGGLSLDGIDGDGAVVILLGIALVAIVLVTSGYLIWCAPDVLSEAAFGAALTGTLARSARKQAPNGWVEGVVKKTWWPFAVVLVAAIAFAWYVHTHYPQASTFRQAITLALG
jgi:hypothetical protein